LPHPVHLAVNASAAGELTNKNQTATSKKWIADLQMSQQVTLLLSYNVLV